MAKKPTDESELPSADDLLGAPAEAPAAPAVEDTRPIFEVSAKGLETRRFRADDEADAARQFYKFHSVASHEYNHRVTRV